MFSTSKPKQQLFDHFRFFFFPQRNSHQFLTHVNAPFQYFMFLYGVLTIEHGNGGHILLSYFTGSVSIFSTELCTPVQREANHGKKNENTGKFKWTCRDNLLHLFSTRNVQWTEAVPKCFFLYCFCPVMDIIRSWFTVIHWTCVTHYLYTSALLKVNSLSDVISRPSGWWRRLRVN